MRREKAYGMKQFYLSIYKNVYKINILQAISDSYNNL